MADWFNALQTNWISWFSDFQKQFYLNFIAEDRWKYLWNGLGVTLRITFFAVLLGIVIGMLVAIIRASHDNNIATMRRGSASRFLLRFLNGLAKVYLTIIRGTPIVVQLLIMAFVVFSISIEVAILTFGINSGAYVAEIIRSGIMSIDKGQFEAGRSLGFNYVQTMAYIILPQAFKNVLPALANEFIVLLKETSVVGYAAIADLTKGANIIQGRTFNAFMPLIAVAVIYLLMVMFFTWLVGKLERRLQNRDH